ncbi:hypothetical protein B0H11DRAFT_2019679 [Mycena galericulata]|nr:hypothetical protein B0H11DRAFT_2019679 [Mycena galericulata]
MAPHTTCISSLIWVRACALRNRLPAHKRVACMPPLSRHTAIAFRHQRCLLRLRISCLTSTSVASHAFAWELARCVQSIVQPSTGQL